MMYGIYSLLIGLFVIIVNQGLLNSLFELRKVYLNMIFPDGSIV
jgi:hypothetical protein